jgi:hypothetical protein
MYITQRTNGVRFRTEISLFFRDFAFKFGTGVTASRALTINSKGACGLV